MTLESAPWVDALDGDNPALALQALVAGVLRRDRASERQLYERYSPRLRRFAVGLVRDPHDASDVVQETFARAIRLLPTLERPAELAPWLHGIARNVCLECLRSRKRARLAPTKALLALDHAPSPEHELMGRQSAELVTRALAAMPEPRREALRLRVEHGLGYREIATLMGWSLAKAKVEVHRARRLLDAAIRGPEERRRARGLAGAFALALTLALGGVLVGAGPGELPEDVPRPADTSAPSIPVSRSNDASSEELPMSLPAPVECEAGERAAAPPEPTGEIPWSDAPVTKAIEAP